MDRRGDMANGRQRRPLNVQLAPGSVAEDIYHRRKGLPGAPGPAKDIAPGIPPTPAHDLVFYGGKTMRDLRYVNFFVGGDVWTKADMGSIDHALAAAMSDANLNDVMAQYFPGGPITTTFDGSTVLPGPAPALVSQGDAEVMVGRLHADGKLAGRDLSTTVVNLLLPQGTVLSDDAKPTAAPMAAVQTAPRNPVPIEEEADSLHGLGGFHGSIHPPAGSGTTATVYYAIGVYSEQRADGTMNGIAVFDKPWKNVVGTFYHELNEVRTDADVGDAIRAGNDPNATKFLGWLSDQGEECGDFPVFEAHPLSQVFQEVPLTDGSGTVPVQFQYSNRVHGPEGPAGTTPGPQPQNLDDLLHAATREVVLAWLFDAKLTGDTRLDDGLGQLSRVYRLWEGRRE